MGPIERAGGVEHAHLSIVAQRRGLLQRHLPVGLGGGSGRRRAGRPCRLALLLAVLLLGRLHEAPLDVVRHVAAHGRSAADARQVAQEAIDVVAHPLPAVLALALALRVCRCVVLRRHETESAANRLSIKCVRLGRWGRHAIMPSQTSNQSLVRTCVAVLRKKRVFPFRVRPLDGGGVRRGAREGRRHAPQSRRGCPPRGN